MVQLIKMIAELGHDNMSNERYNEVFEGLWEAHLQQGGNIANQPGLIAARADEIAAENGRAMPDADDIAEAEAYVHDKIKACFMLSNADKNRHSDLKKHCENSYTMNQEEFPDNTTELLNQMNNWRPTGNSRPPQRAQANVQAAGGEEDGVNFAQEGEEDDNVGVNMFIGLDGGCNDDEDEEVRDDGAQQGRRRRRKPRKKKVRFAEETAGVREQNAGVTAASTDGGLEEKKICVHCGKNDHNLDSCPDMSDEQLAQILVQLDDLNVSDETAVMLLQKRREAGSNWGATVASALRAS